MLLLGGAIAGCGGGDSYCDALESADEDFSALSQSDVDKVEDAFAAFHDIAAKAPKAVKADWKVLEGTIDALESSFKDAGLDYADLPKLQGAELPEGVDKAKIPAIVDAISKFGGAEFQKAVGNIGTHAQDECNIKFAG